MSWGQVAASVIGGLFGSKDTTKESWKGSYGSLVGHAQGAIEGYRRTGINPLTLLGATPSSGQPWGVDPMGQAFADAAMFAADSFLKKGNQQALLVNEYQRQNKELQDRLTHVTLQPKVPGVYGGGDGAAAGVADPVLPVEPSGGGRVAGPAGRPLSDVDRGFLADERRPVDNEDVKSHPGYMLVDNPALPVPMRVLTLDGDEPLHWYEYPSVAQPLATMAWDIGTAGNGRGIHTEFNARKLTEREEREEWRIDNGYAKKPKKRPRYFSELPDPSSAFAPRMKFPWE